MAIITLYYQLTLFNDMLGTTQGSISQDGKYQPTNKTAFGQSTNKTNFFTGKPYVEGLGAVFLFRNYRPELGKWQTSDPLGYPDGWNNLAYGNNAVTSGIDYQGTVWILVPGGGEYPTSKYSLTPGTEYDTENVGYRKLRDDTLYNRYHSIVSRVESNSGTNHEPGDTNTITLIFKVTVEQGTITMGMPNEGPQIWEEVSRNITTTINNVTVERNYVWE